MARPPSRRIVPVYLVAAAMCLVSSCGTASAIGSSPARSTSSVPTGTGPTATGSKSALPATSDHVVTDPGPWDWPTYGQNPEHTFDGRTTLTAKTAATLKEAWGFHTGDAFTAPPTVADGPRDA